VADGCWLMVRLKSDRSVWLAVVVNLFGSNAR